jgi:hypothetical protein
MRRDHLLGAALAAGMFGCASGGATAPTAATPVPASVATPAPAAASPAGAVDQGWRSLFDGRTAAGWRGFRLPGFPERGWTITDGTLRSDAGGDMDIVTEQAYSRFELQLQFRLQPGANSGIKFLVDEALVPRGHHGLGFEYQLIDDDRHPDARQGKPGTRTCGALYDLIAPGPGKVVRPPGEWNQLRLVVDGARVEHWLNGVKLLEFQPGSPQLAALIAGSKYRSQPAFGSPTRGHILLQAHGDEVAFREIRVRELPPPRVAER